MTTVIIDTRSKEAKRLVDYLKTVKYVKVVENRDEKMGEYDPDFVKMLNERKKQPSIKLDVDNLWK